MYHSGRFIIAARVIFVPTYDAHTRLVFCLGNIILCKYCCVYESTVHAVQDSVCNVTTFVCGCTDHWVWCLLVFEHARRLCFLLLPCCRVLSCRRVVDVLDRLWFNIGVVCFSINAVILAYLTVWLPHVRGVRVSWNVYSPRAIPTATVVGLICALA